MVAAPPEGTPTLAAFAAAVRNAIDAAANLEPGSPAGSEPQARD